MPRRDRREPIRQFKGNRMAHLKRGANSMVLSCCVTASVISAAGHGRHSRTTDRNGIEHFRARRPSITHAVARASKRGFALNWSVGRKRHPECVEFGCDKAGLG